MREKTLSIAFADSLKEESLSCISEYAEIGLDAIMEDGVLKDIPIVSTAVALYKIGSSIKERHNLKKLLIFLNEINKGIVGEEKLKKYRKKFQSNEKFRNQEIEYLLVILDRYIGYDKPKALARLYLAYIDEIVDWKQFLMFSDMLDRLFIEDIDMLVNLQNAPCFLENTNPSVYRLSFCGLLVDNGNQFNLDSDGTLTMTEEKKYSISNLGEILKRVMQ